MRESSTVSIVLPAYRAVDHVRTVIPEMITEVEKLGAGLEVIVVVNGPRDGTDEAAADLHAADGRVRVAARRRRGVGPSRAHRTPSRNRRHARLHQPGAHASARVAHGRRTRVRF